MPIVRIDYEKEKIQEQDIRKVAEAIQKIAAEATGYGEDEISVFASENQITVNAAPVEIYIYATFPDVTPEDMQAMLDKAAVLLKPFKEKNNITTPFNLSVVKMNWKFKLEV